jgi:hypothetical protein
MITRFDANMVQLGTTIVSDAPEYTSTLEPSVASLSGGGFAVTWTSETGGGRDVAAALVDNSGALLNAGNIWLTTDLDTTVEKHAHVTSGDAAHPLIVAWNAPTWGAVSASGVRFRSFDTDFAPLAPTHELLPPPNLPYSYPYSGGCWDGQGSSWYPWTYPDPDALWCADDNVHPSVIMGAGAAFGVWGASVHAQISISGSTYGVSGRHVTYGSRVSL